MNRRNQLGTALVVLAAVLFVVPAFFPVQPMLMHDTERSANAPPAELEAEGLEIVAYENMSDRGKELYRTTLERDGEYSVPQGEGATEFDYPTAEERRQAYENDAPSRPGAIVIERPADDSSLPESDERYFGPREEGEDPESENESQRREMIMRYDVMSTSTEMPPLGATPQLLRLGAVLLAVVFLGVGGYLISTK
jgi:hypothetical protein